MPLDTYRKKRRFDRTAEPSGEGDSDATGKLAFVVQLHHASRRHYDFRLQVGDVLKSWAVPKGPSYDPAVKRMAVEVEDHPLSYATFEGAIPKGEYGGGHVAQFDHGTWAPDGDIDFMLEKGHLQFQLFGGKLRGGWHLIRTHKPAKQQQWLLVKADDEWAQPLEADDLLGDVTPAPAEDIKRAGGGKAGKLGRTRISQTGAVTPANPGVSTAETASGNTTSSNMLTTSPAISVTPAIKGVTAGQTSANTSETRTRRNPSSADWAARAAKLEGARKAKLNPLPFTPELAKAGASPPKGADWLHEIKWDGYRLLVIIADFEAHVFSRNALDWTAKVPVLAEAAQSLGLTNAVIDGELIAGRGSREDFNLLQAVLGGRSTAALRFVAFDLLHVDGVDISASPLHARKALLQEVIAAATPSMIGFSTHSEGDGAQALQVAVDAGFEGIISKRRDSTYHPGRGDDWRKTKAQDSAEFAIVGYTPPKGARKGIGSLLLATPDAEHGWRYVGRVGSGLDDMQLQSLGERFAGSGAREPSVFVPENDTDLRAALWFAPDKIVEVHTRGTGGHGLLRQASFKTLREDKTVTDLTRDAGMAEKPSTKPVPARKRRAGAKATDAASPSSVPKTKPTRKTAALTTKDDRAWPALSSPDKVLFPEDAITKQQVWDYYAAVLPWLLPEISGRPLSVIRCPAGIAAQCFFQKHYTHGLDRVSFVALKEDRGKTADYIVATDAASVMELVQFNTLEFHPWGALAATPDTADTLVFDLDPDTEVAWKTVVAAAREVREHLTQAGLESFVRTSGGKGLHVVVPLNPGTPWSIAKPFAHAFADALVALAPERYIATATKAQRKAKIFIDYLRNARGATSVASFSLRGRAGAPVAMPLKWEELGRITGGNAFDIHNTPARLKRWKAHPWGDFRAIEQSLPKF